jgi:SAM-dependent methyltransferase
LRLSAIERWKDKVRVVRAAREREGESTGARYWDETRAAWFNRFAGQSDRSHTYRFIAPYVRGRVLEVGPGPGAYTRLLLRDGVRVVAVEPSPFMVRLLRQNLGDRDDLTIVESTIEEYLDRLETYDLTLAANVLGGIERIDEVLSQVAARSDVLAIVIAKYTPFRCSNARSPDWSRDVQVRLLGRVEPQPDMPDHDDLLAVLDELGLSYAVHPADVPIYTFDTPEEVVDWVQGFHGLPDERRAELERVLAPHIVEQGDKYGLPSRRDTRVVLVGRGVL